MKQSILLIMTVALLASCSHKDTKTSNHTPEQIATCIAEQATITELHRLGTKVAYVSKNSPVQLNRFEHLSCRGWVSIFDKDETRTQLGEALSATLASNRSFREGVQYSIWRQAGLLPEVATALATLTIQAGRNMVVRAWATSCQYDSQAAVADLNDLVAPYLTAYIGLRGWAPTARSAAALAESVIDQATSHAAYDVASIATTNCKDPLLQSEYNAQAKILKSFKQGTNMDVPGCTVVMQANEYALSCKEVQPAKAVSVSSEGTKP